MKNKNIKILILIFGLIFLAAIITRGFGLFTDIVPKEEVLPPVGPVKEFTISGTEYSFNPSSITVSTGDRVKITFQNIGRAPHNLTIEGLGVSTRTIRSGQTDTIEFTALTPGTYTFICSVPGHAAAGMVGNLIVE